MIDPNALTAKKPKATPKNTPHRPLTCMAVTMSRGGGVAGLQTAELGDEPLVDLRLDAHLGPAVRQAEPSVQTESGATNT